MEGFKINDSYKDLFSKNIPEAKRGKSFSIRDSYGMKVANQFVGDSKIHDANFAFLTTSLAKLHKELYEPKWFVTWNKDIDQDIGGAFVDYIEYYSVDWAGIMNANRNIVGNSVNYVPRVNAGLNQERANVYTYEVAYDLRFVELEKMKKLTLQKSIQTIYNDAIVAGWNLFVQDVAYKGVGNTTGLFNSSKVFTTAISDSGATGDGFTGLSDATVVAFINGIFQYYLENSNMNATILPDTILAPTFVVNDLTSRFSPLYTSTLYQFLLDHNLGRVQDQGLKLRIEGRPDLNNLGTNGTGRIVAYRKDKSFVRIDIPYPIQHYITLPNIERMSYTTVFVGQVSNVQLMYNTSSAELGVVTYWDFGTRE